MNLSKNLTLAEVTKSTTAKRLGIDNTPDEWTTENLRQVAINIFQPLREAFGCPIYVSSGYRSGELNTAIGGSTRSQHVEGRALDLDADVYGGCTNSQIFNWIKENVEFDQLIWEFGDDENPDWVHVSFKAIGEQRNQILQAKRNSAGKTYYELWTKP